MNSSCTLVSRILVATVIGLGSLAFAGGDASASPVDACVSAADCEPNEACVTGEGPAYCACKPGYREGIYGCDDINECGEGTDNCSDDAECINRWGTFSCRCDAGFEGDGVTCTAPAPAVTEPVDECASAADCEPNMACVTGDGPAYCACKPGYRDGIYGCDDINECWEGTDNCSDDAACINRWGSFSCKCNSGFKGNGVTCTGSSTSPRSTTLAKRSHVGGGGEGVSIDGDEQGDDADASFAAASDASEEASASDGDADDDDSATDASAAGGMCSAGPGGADPSAIATLLAAAAIIVSRRRKS